MTKNRKVFINGLPGSTTDAELTELCGAHGKVMSARVLSFFDRRTGRRSGFGLIEMECPEDGRDVIVALNGTALHGATLRCFTV